MVWLREEYLKMKYGCEFFSSKNYWSAEELQGPRRLQEKYLCQEEMGLVGGIKFKLIVLRE